MKRRRFPLGSVLVVQLIVGAAFGVAYGAMITGKTQPTWTASASMSVEVPREMPLRIQPLYNDAEVVSDDELAAVLKQIRPVFQRDRMKPNFVEHALRAWGIHAEFQDPQVISGAEMADFLTDHGKYLASWGDETDPLLIDRPNGVSIRWGREAGGSVHHDHWLACLTEAGIPLDAAIFTPTRRDMTIEDALQEALRDFRLDERETEWSAMAFGLWLPATRSWTNSTGRQLSFDDLARRLMRGHKRFGVCNGTHRLYSLTVLVRLDDEFEILTPAVREDIFAHLANVRELLKVSQFEDGHWPADWSNGADAVENPKESPLYRSVISTGHHLEWLAIAPEELHPPREMILKAADWIIHTTVEQTPEEILGSFTFFSHVGNALALWRGTHPAEFWREWQKTHPYVPTPESEQANAEAENNDAETDATAEHG